MDNTPYVDTESGAWIFPPNPVKNLERENAQLKGLLKALLGALPAKILEKIPEEHVRVVTDVDQ